MGGRGFSARAKTIMCNDITIKELLPAYLEKGLGHAEKLRVDQHIASCEDCRAELSLLRMMANEPVPDPGEAFWTAMPGRIYRDVRRQEQKSIKHWGLSIFTGRLPAPGWAWATAAISIVAVLSWFMVRPASVDIARTIAPHNNEAPFEDIIPVETVDVAELSSSEIEAATQWAQNEFAPIQETISKDASENTERDFSEDLTQLSPRELDRLYEMLKKKEQDIQKMLHKKPANDKRIG